MALLNEAIAPGVLTHIADHDLISRVVNERHGVHVVNPVAGQHYAPDMAAGETHVVNLPAAGVVTIDAPVSSDPVQAWLPGAELVVVLVSPAGSTATVAWAAAYVGGSPVPQAGATVVGRWRNITTDASPAVWVPAAAPSGAFAGHTRATAQGSADVASVVKGFIGQSADLEQWQNSAGVVLSHVDAAGAIWEGANHVYSAGNPNLAGSVAASTAFGQAAAVGSGTAYARNDHVHGTPPTPATSVAGRTGAVVLTAADVGAGSFPGAVTFSSTTSHTGTATFNGATFNGTVAFNAAVTTGSITETGQTLSQPSIASQVPQVIKGFAGQSADLTQWQDSTGAVKSTISATGIYNVTGIAYVGDTSTATTTLLRAGVASNTAVVVQGAASQTGDLTDWTSSAGAVLAKVTSAGGGQFSGAVVNLTTGSQLGSSTNLLLPGSASQPALVAKGLASQSGSLTQWQDSTGAVLASISPIGQLSTPVLSVAGGPTTGASIFGQVPTGQGAGVAFMLLRDSGGADIFRVMPNGQVFSQVNATAAVASITKGAAGQTADLAEWQSSTGTVNASIAADGAVFSRSFVQASGYSLHGNASRYGATSTAIVSVNTGAAGNEAIVARGTASQSADLQQWQDSTAAVLAKITSAGSLVVAGASPRSAIGSAGVISLTALAVSPGAGEAGVTPLGVRGVASQSANLTTWQSSTPATVAAVTSTGNVQGTGAYTTLSDAAAKTNVRALVHDPLDVVRRLKPRHFDYTAGGFGGGERDQVGFVAQELQAVLPQAVVPFGDDRLGTRSEAIVAYLVAAVQELDRRLAA